MAALHQALVNGHGRAQVSLVPACLLTADGQGLNNDSAALQKVTALGPGAAGSSFDEGWGGLFDRAPA